MVTKLRARKRKGLSVGNCTFGFFGGKKVFDNSPRITALPSQNILLLFKFSSNFQHLIQRAYKEAGLLDNWDYLCSIALPLHHS